MRHSLRKMNTRLLALAVAVLLLLSMTPRAAADELSGACGDKLTWSLSGDTLTISGSGEMYDFPESTMAPWYEYRAAISTVVLPEGLTRVGDLAFYGCTALLSVRLPNSVTEVGWHAFDGCTAMTMLDLGSGLRIIEDSAFRECTSLKALRLPDTLTTLGFQAFYRCESLTAVTVPASVTDMGMSAFAFCYNLVRANIQARIAVLPDWTFYGCSRLTDLTLPETLESANEYAFFDCTGLQNVEYTGDPENLAQIKDDIGRDLEAGSGLISVSDSPTGDSSSSSVFEETDEGVISDTTTTTQTDNATVTTEITVTYPDGNADGSTTEVQVDITLENSDGWDEAQDALQDALENADSVAVDVYVKDDSAVDGEILNSLAGQDVTLTVHSPSGAEWEVDCSSLVTGELAGEYDITYQRTDASEDQLEMLGTDAGFEISFNGSAQINAEVLTKLPVDYARQTATLCQVEKGQAVQLQSVVVDSQGYAHFYLGAVDEDTQYLVGINMTLDESQSVLVPEELHSEYGITGTAGGMEYVITGVSSSWNMNIGQVTGILAAVMVGSIIVIGVVMFMLNKRKLKNGYIPELDEEEIG